MLIGIAGFILIWTNQPPQPLHHNISEDNILEVKIHTLPPSENYARLYTDSTKISAITRYLNKLSLQSKFPEQPNEYVGMAYFIEISYADGSHHTVTHYGNMFIRMDNEPWKRMIYEEAEVLEQMIHDYPSD